MVFKCDNSILVLIIVTDIHSFYFKNWLNHCKLIFSGSLADSTKCKIKEILFSRNIWSPGHILVTWDIISYHEQYIQPVSFHLSRHVTEATNSSSSTQRSYLYDVWLLLQTLPLFVLTITFCNSNRLNTQNQ